MTIGNDSAKQGSNIYSCKQKAEEIFIDRLARIFLMQIEEKQKNGQTNEVKQSENQITDNNKII